MAPNDRNLSHEEIWDDSALVDSWNEALAEYKKYHSIYSKGGNVDDLKAEQSVPSFKPDPDSEINDGDKSVAQQRSVGQSESGPKTSETGDGPEAQPSRPSVEGPASIPAPLLASVRDESLKKLLMSWYYAGYYTGLYEGQQQREER